MFLELDHLIKGRARFSTGTSFDIDQANKIKYLLESIDGIQECYVYKRTGSIRISYDYNLKEAVDLLEDLKFSDLDEVSLPEIYDFQEEVEVFDIVRDSIFRRLIVRYALPLPLRTAYTLIGAAKFIGKGIKTTWDRKELNVELLDATAIATSILTGDMASAGSIMFLLNLGEDLEDWTMEKSKKDLSMGLSLNIDKVWVLEGDRTIEKPLVQVKIGDILEVTTGNTIPVDGQVYQGEASVNESSFTGEPLAVLKSEGLAVHGGTVVEEGNLLVKATKLPEDSKVNELIKLIADSEELKSSKQRKAESMADGLVKYSFIGAGLTYLLTRNIERAKAFLMVDFSCALKLAIPIANMSAMTQAMEEDMLVKGGKYLEALSSADTIVFDKTGTLTEANPKVIDVISFSDYPREQIIKTAACLEEHFPHSIANAVVDFAEDQGVHHRGENHSTPEYIVGHGIVAQIDGKRACIESEHFILEDEGVEISSDVRDTINQLKETYSVLYLAYDHELVAVFCIEDPIRDGTHEIIRELRDLGFERLVMLTGDSQKCSKTCGDKSWL